MILKIIQQIIQMFDKIQMILMMKTSISNNRISRLKIFIMSEMKQTSIKWSLASKTSSETYEVDALQP